MLALALWLKEHGFRADQVQAFLPSPMASATAMYHTGKNPLRKLRRDGGEVVIAKGPTQRKLHKAFLRYHDANNWPLLRQALVRMGREELIGYAKTQLIPPRQPAGWVPPEERVGSGKKEPTPGSFRTQHTGLPPRNDPRARKRKNAHSVNIAFSPDRRWCRRSPLAARSSCRASASRRRRLAGGCGASRPGSSRSDRRRRSAGR